MHVLVAPDKFKGTLSADTASRAMERGVLAAVPDALVTRIPLADGGEGTVDVLATTEGARRDVLRVDAAEAFEAPVVHLADGSICLEVATTSGNVGSRDALTASSARTGEALAELLRTNPKSVLVAIGGSASTDGGAGMAAALGWTFLDGSGAELEAGGGALGKLARVDGSHAVQIPCPVIGLCDVANPLLGEVGSARRFGPQKGASPHDVELLEAGLVRLAEVVRSQLRIEIGTVPLTGAGGGIAAGLVAFLGGELRTGFGSVADAVSLRDALAQADLVITGEGRLDEGSLAGKVTSSVARMARVERKPVLAVCGEVALDDQRLEALGFTGTAGMISAVGRENALASPEDGLALSTQRAIDAWAGATA